MPSAINRSERVDLCAEARAALARYPYISDAELTALLRWFRKEASAIEVATLSADPEVASAFQRFKQEHLDRIKGANLFWKVTTAFGLATAAATIGWSLT
jgi:hypothetical protein